MERKKIKIYIFAGKARAGKNESANKVKEYYLKKNLKTINLSFGYYIKEYAKKISNWDGNEETKPRELLQRLGTEIIREQIDKNFFINRIVEDIEVYSYFFDIITISDARYPEEIETIKNRFNSYSIKVERINAPTNLAKKEKEHITETALDNYNSYDYIINNNKTLDDLTNSVNKMLEGLQ